MDELSQTRKMHLTPFTKPAAAALDDSDIWMGGEAAVGAQAGRHVRRSERSTPGLALTILGLTFFGGLALGTVATALLRKKSR